MRHWRLKVVPLFTVAFGFIAVEAGFPQPCRAEAEKQPTTQATRAKVKQILVVPLLFPDVRPGNLNTAYDAIRDNYSVSLRKYIQEVSYGQVDINVTVAPWVNMPNPISSYRLSSWRLKEMGETFQKRKGLVNDACSLVDDAFDLSQFDALMLAVGANASDLGRNGYLFRTAWGYPAVYTLKGRRCPPADVHVWNSPIPSITYALPKLIAGYENRRSVVPTLYDREAQSTPGPFGYANRYVGGDSGHQYFSVYMGPWDNLSQHGVSTEDGFVPQGLTSFTKLKLGWIKKEQISNVENGTLRKIRLSPLTDGDGPTLVVRILLDDMTYYLIENRQQKGVDRVLPSEGVLIMKADDAIPEMQGTVRVVDAHPGVKYFQEAPFKAGEHYRDDVSGIVVKVLSKEGEDYWIEVQR